MKGSGECAETGRLFQLQRAALELAGEPGRSLRMDKEEEARKNENKKQRQKEKRKIKRWKGKGKRKEKER